MPDDDTAAANDRPAFNPQDMRQPSLELNLDSATPLGNLDNKMGGDIDDDFDFDNVQIKEEK